ncbi:hypothetical protein ACFU3E_06550 [Streptomyces sp. NPDC057424]|uniref:hypothetical protein n=1 Tax=Streptomyces sp. NPDC057424 TaxID=3346127 RepID=UPI00368EEDE4
MRDAVFSTWRSGPRPVGRRPDPALFDHGGPGPPPRFAAAPDGSLLLSSDGAGTVPRPAPNP